tara:strand:+ start:24824 stop:25828 length:1005 start_codon:yes stop_codon:yes gene_type:complete
MLVLGIESSCDETGVALYSDKDGLIDHSVNSQVDLFKEYGGVIPEIAARDHSNKIIKILKNVLKENDIEIDQVDLIAYTAGPGLIGSLMIGETVAKTIAKIKNIEIMPVHHLEGHILAPGIENKSLRPPYLCLLVSGGHTQIIDCNDYGQYSILGETIDDACGEAFDKVGKLLRLEYPGGPKVAELAKKGNCKRFNFPRALTKSKNLNFSFSGLKTSVLYEMESLKETDYADVAASFQAAVVDVLVTKLSWALEESNHTKLICSGGVAANEMLREQLDRLAKKMEIDVYYPSLELCTDNAAMIAYVGYIRKSKNLEGYDAKFSKPRWPLGELYA